MENRTITLRCLRRDGRRESTKVERLDLHEAHDMAERILQIGNGLYARVEICTDGGCIETVQKEDTVDPINARPSSFRLQ
jgi:hypothetical protein